MAGSTKLRLVRCPKCENLLPELADYSVYQCGGCGAVLRAKDKNRDTDTLSLEKSEEVRVAGAATNSPNSVEKVVFELSDASDTDVKSNASSLECGEKNPVKNDMDRDDLSRNPAKSASGKWVVENGLEGDRNRDDWRDAAGREPGEMNLQIRYNSGTRRSGQMLGRQRGERSGMEGFQRILRSEGEGMRFSTSNYPDEGPSNYNFDSSYGYGEQLRNVDEQSGASKVQYLEKDRAELLRKLDELKDQLSRSCDVADKPSEKVPLNGRMAPPDSYGGSDTWFAGSSSMSNRASMQFFAPDRHAKGPSYLNHHPESFAYTNGHEMPISFHPSVHKSNLIPGYGDPFGSQIPRRTHKLPGQYQQPPQQYFSGHYFDTNPDLFEPYPSNAAFHQPSCSCFHCYEKHHGVSAPVPPASFGNKRFPDMSNNPMMYQHGNSRAFGPHINNSRITAPSQLNFRSSQSHARWPSDLNSEMTGFVRPRPRRVVLAGGGRCCRPIAGGAPFLTCFNCFELLQLPKKVPLMANNQQKMQCGTCSSVINFSVVNKKLMLSVNTEATQIPTEVDDSSSEMIKTHTSYSQGHINRINANFSSDDYDNSGYDFQTVETDPIGHHLNSSNPQETQSFHSSSPSTSEYENIPDILIAPRDVINGVQQSSLSPPPPGSPLQQHFDYSANNHAVNRFGKGNRSSRADHERVVTNKANTRQNSMKETPVATEMEVSFPDYSNTAVSQDSGDASREDGQSRNNKGGDSFFANIIKKSFKDFSRSHQTDEHGRNNVMVNGHHIPDRVVKKAEKQAGPIHPGQYWYDYRAGFWGIIGGPCLGIIPPFIEELNYPMPENCAGGSTGVFVNGRELHQKDFDLLASRGLPTERDRSYIVEISGRVVDEDTREEMDSLGKLAPTVEKVKHGFGMKVPKAAVQ
ncbi:EXTRA-LARGE G-PROTEIN-LIKE [Salix purpurea]|uniref:EXTRA-LARGE G-PROTEIN-LIKE n=2 Tax=Salix purpurea TaxID=77065 RepID=A0A9Q0P1C4_SALPP|nr:EXTRA-LARGE G-PROTEIN-LIKE [Salix purpurea]